MKSMAKYRWGGGKLQGWRFTARGNTTFLAFPNTWCKLRQGKDLSNFFYSMQVDLFPEKKEQRRNENLHQIAEHCH